MSWTNVNKPTGIGYTKISKSPSDLNLYGYAIYGTNKYGEVNSYTNIAKPSTGTWTNISKPT